VLIDRVIQWNACVNFLPLWLAPNMVTLLGFFFVLGNVFLLQVMDPELQGPKQAWVCYSYAFGVWAYSTMDNIDGKQARRTGTSSGLGELFDHGIDSLNCTLASLLETSAMGLGPTRLGESLNPNYTTSRPDTVVQQSLDDLERKSLVC